MNIIKLMKKVFIALSISILTCNSVYSFGEIPLSQLKKLNQTLFSVYEMYVDSVQAEKLVESAIIGMLEDLDPHSSYTTAKEVARLNEQIDGSFDGIGIQFQMLNDTLFVIQTFSGCPADRVGVLPGDRIIGVSDKNIAGVKMTTSDIMSLIRGKSGTFVKIAVKRSGVEKPIEFLIKRGKIPVHSLDVAYMIAPNVGYVKLNSFSATTTKEFHEAMSKLQAQGMTELLLDLQGNGGGLMRSAIDLADDFLTSGQTIVYTQGRSYPQSTARATNSGQFESLNVVILVDEYSASASEILAGALQDWDRAVIVGRRTFGKGLVQTPMSLIDGSLIRLTVARYYTPSGRNIQKPYDKGIENYHRDLEKRFKHGELQSADSINFPDSLQYKTLRLGRTVYGGGGIMPDIFVPLDTTRTTDYHRNIVAKGVMNKTVLEYIEQNRKKLMENYKNFEIFNKKFEVDSALLNTLKENGEKEKVAFNEKEFEQSKRLISLQMKALIARDLYESGDYYKVMNAENDIIQRGLEVLKNSEQYLK